MLDDDPVERSRRRVSVEDVGELRAGKESSEGVVECRFCFFNRRL